MNIRDLYMDSAKIDFYNKLLEGLILYTYVEGKDLTSKEEALKFAIREYQHNPIFHSRVKGLAAGIMSLVENYGAMWEKK